eukprot:510019-Lingulodinium_polyedra.AAC.1
MLRRRCFRPCFDAGVVSTRLRVCPGAVSTLLQHRRRLLGGHFNANCPRACCNGALRRCNAETLQR